MFFNQKVSENKIMQIIGFQKSFNKNCFANQSSIIKNKDFKLCNGFQSGFKIVFRVKSVAWKFNIESTQMKNYCRESHVHI